MTRSAYPPHRDVIVIGASRGCVRALIRIVSRLPHPPAGILFVVIHRSPFYHGDLAALLRGDTRQDVVEARDGERPTPGRIYLEPPDQHMTVHERRVRLSRGPKEHFTRPAIDPLFRSAASAYGSSVVG